MLDAGASLESGLAFWVGVEDATAAACAFFDFILPDVVDGASTSVVLEADCVRKRYCFAIDHANAIEPVHVFVAQTCIKVVFLSRVLDYGTVQLATRHSLPLRKVVTIVAHAFLEIIRRAHCIGYHRTISQAVALLAQIEIVVAQAL